MSKIATKYVTVSNPNGSDRTFAPDEEIPEPWASQITNEDTFVDSEAPEAPEPQGDSKSATSSDEEGSGPLSDRKVAELRAMAERLEVELTGAKTKDDIVGHLVDSGKVAADGTEA